MPAAGDDLDGILTGAVDQAVFGIDAAAPEAGQVAFQGFRLAQALEGISSDIPQQFI